ncbi:MAG: ferredoxin reductase [Aquificaceae bacterium]|nr:ferredoxin reductase [Aquificaceae bacterium]MCS7195872.1 ferredoxin reductase [Aquificaceae bacterium]MDW8032331.1 ferredoxin reductase [Aquificaceae bacterium]
MELEKKPIREFRSRVLKVLTETPTTKTLVFDLKGVDFDFYPGQYVMLHVPYEGEVLKRAYSIASPPTQKDTLELTIKRTPKGRASVVLTEQTKEGEEFYIKGPYGKFLWLPEMGRNLVLIGAGSGIVPLMCILRYIVSAKLEHVRATLLYSNTHYEEIIYREELERLEKYSNIKVVNTLTRSYPPNWKGYTGRIDMRMVLKEVEDIPANLYYLCGPPQFVEDMASLITDLGVDREQIKKEKYD